MVSINYTLIAQIVNFLILLWILAKFAYKPLLKAMDDRRMRIVKDMDNAENARKDAEALKQQYVDKMKDAKKEANAIIAKANAQAQQIHDEMLAQAQKEREEILNSGRDRVEAERKKALLDVREQVIALSTEIAGRVLEQKLTSQADQDLVARVTDKTLAEKNK
ncbi:MAG: F0F1 ATP synthase subunit B [Acidaminococcus sp.]|nr:F0F1 ATP synthase subunit B [Acidaminococcus sp.]MCI2099899.1 F0F1 ATP synthase subunit B [Acidaminococcus sp.]MCI2114130.1 F0F1 ATP synthase subunit B [Acidaminococcus sp.]MCI2116070.1 F0F1 ATP synthase subunit B [Acidaminococcus sp.]